MKRNNRVLNKVELYVVERELHKEIKEEYKEVKESGEGLWGIDELLAESLERMMEYRALLMVENLTPETLGEYVKNIEVFRQGYKGRMTGVNQNGVEIWLREDVVREYKRRYEAGLSLRATVLQKVDPGLYMAGHRLIGGGIYAIIHDVLESTYDKVYEDTGIYYGTNNGKKPVLKRKYVKRGSTGGKEVVKIQELKKDMYDRKVKNESNSLEELKNVGYKFTKEGKNLYLENIKELYGEHIENHLKVKG